MKRKTKNGISLLLLLLAVSLVLFSLAAQKRKGKRLPHLQASVQTDFFHTPYIHVVSSDSVAFKVLDVVADQKYHLFGFCDSASGGKLDTMGMPHFFGKEGVAAGFRFPRYDPSDPSYPLKMLGLVGGCVVPGKDALQMGESADVRYKDFGDVNGDTFEPMDVQPVVLEVKTDRGSASFNLTLP